jgi:hypothetical protein
MARPLLWLACAGVLLCALPGGAAASDSLYVPNRFRITVAGTFSSLDTQASIGPAGGGVGAALVLEDLFDVPLHKSFFEMDGTWNCSGRHHVDAGYLDVARTGQSIVENEFTVGDYTFQAGATSEAYFDSRFIYAAYRYDLLDVKPVRISASLGVNATYLEVRISGSGGIVDSSGQSVDHSVSVEGKVPLPVPLLGVQLDWAISDRGHLESYQRVVGIDTEDLRGSMTQWKIRYHYYLTPNVGLGVGYEALDVRLPRYQTEDRMLRFSYGIHGFTFSLQGAF